MNPLFHTAFRIFNEVFKVYILYCIYVVGCEVKILDGQGALALSCR